MFLPFDLFAITPTIYFYSDVSLGRPGRTSIYILVFQHSEMDFFKPNIHICRLNGSKLAIKCKRMSVLEK